MSNDRSRTEPIGLHVQRVAKLLNRAFEDELAQVGGVLDKLAENVSGS